MQDQINCYLSSFNTHGKFVSNNVNEILNTSSGFFFQFEACLIYCFHVFCFECFVIYIPRVYFIEVKVELPSTFFCFFFVCVVSFNQFLFCNWVRTCIFFLLTKLFIKLEEGVVSLVIKCIENVVSMHLSATWQFWPFQRSWCDISCGCLWIQLHCGLDRPSRG